MARDRDIGNGPTRPPSSAGDARFPSWRAQSPMAVTVDHAPPRSSTVPGAPANGSRHCFGSASLLIGCLYVYYVDQAHGSTCLAASVGTRAWATFVKRTNRNLLSGPSSLGAAECRRFPVRLGTSSSHLRPHALPPLPYHRPSESSPSVLSSGSRGWHRAAPPILLGPTAASISHHHHAQVLTLQPHPLRPSPASCVLQPRLASFTPP